MAKLTLIGCASPLRSRGPVRVMRFRDRRALEVQLLLDRKTRQRRILLLVDDLLGTCRAHRTRVDEIQASAFKGEGEQGRKRVLRKHTCTKQFVRRFSLSLSLSLFLSLFSPFLSFLYRLRIQPRDANSIPLISVPRIFRASGEQSEAEWKNAQSKRETGIGQINRRKERKRAEKS